MTDDTKKQTPPSPTHIRFTREIEDKLDMIKDHSGLPKSEIARICTSIGLRYLQECDYDLATAVMGYARLKTPSIPQPETQPESTGPKLLEPPSSHSIPADGVREGNQSSDRTRKKA